MKPRSLAVSLALGCGVMLACVPTGQAGAQAPRAWPRAAEPGPAAARPGCGVWSLPVLTRNPTEAELRCRHGAQGPGRFGLSVYMEVPVYQPATPLPGTHAVGVPGLPGPRPGESFEEWEWRVLRAQFGPHARHVFRELELLDPTFASRLMQLEEHLRAAGVRFLRRETWRSPERQAYLFQQGRSRPGDLITATLTSWHSAVDPRGVPSGVAADYTVAPRHLHLFHELAWAVGLETYGPESNDPGHVYLPGTRPFPSSELVFLRLLPRVPVVTLSTGRPSDEAVSRHRRAEYRAASEAFAQGAFSAYPEPRLAPGPPIEPRTASIVTPAPLLIAELRPGGLAGLLDWLGRRFR